jgi:hypothetical protein
MVGANGCLENRDEMFVLAATFRALALFVHIPDEVDH